MHNRQSVRAAHNALHNAGMKNAVLGMGRQQQSHCRFPTDKSTFEQHFPTSDKLKVRVLLFEPFLDVAWGFLVYPPENEVYGEDDLLM